MGDSRHVTDLARVQHRAAEWLAEQEGWDVNTARHVLFAGGLCEACEDARMPYHIGRAIHNSNELAGGWLQRAKMWAKRGHVEAAAAHYFAVLDVRSNRQQKDRARRGLRKLGVQVPVSDGTAKDEREVRDELEELERQIYLEEAQKDRDPTEELEERKSESATVQMPSREDASVADEEDDAEPSADTSESKVTRQDELAAMRKHLEKKHGKVSELIKTFHDRDGHMVAEHGDYTVYARHASEIEDGETWLCWYLGRNPKIQRIWVEPVRKIKAPATQAA